MGGEGAMMAANQSLKNNRSLVSKRKDRKLSFVSASNKKTEYNLPKATPQKLQEIKLRMQRENRQRRVKQVVVLSLALTSIISALIYFG